MWKIKDDCDLRQFKWMSYLKLVHKINPEKVTIPQEMIFFIEVSSQSCTMIVNTKVTTKHETYLLNPFKTTTCEESESHKYVVAENV